MNPRPPWPAVLAAVTADTGLPAGLLRPGLRLSDLVATAGEPALLALILAIEDQLPEPFPEDLLDQIDTVDDLLGFADVKRSSGWR